jgi:hypothetical protein
LTDKALSFPASVGEHLLEDFGYSLPELPKECADYQKPE